MNVLGDSFGVGIVQHFTRKHLEKSSTIQTPSDLSQSSGSDSNQPSDDSLKDISGYGGTVEHSPPSSHPPQWSRSTQSSERPQVPLVGGEGVQRAVGGGEGGGAESCRGEVASLGGKGAERKVCVLPHQS